MPAPNRCQGTLLMELLIWMTVLTVIAPPIIHQWLVHRNQYARAINTLQHRIEHMDMYTTLLTDSQWIQSQVSPCCFHTNLHVICYSVKNHRLRRQKRAHESSYFYTHYIGNIPNVQTITCTTSSQQLHVSLDIGTPSHDWSFWLPNIIR